MTDNGKRFEGALRLSPGAAPVPEIMTGPRIGLSRATEVPWRFGLAGADGLSRPFGA
jgi:DNA-3-methyladenine glycosylase